LDCCSIIGVHPAEKIVAQVSSSILLIFTVILVVAVSLCSTPLLNSLFCDLVGSVGIGLRLIGWRAWFVL
jgi:hypothetical protein